jgi:hypothetical protein
MPRKSIPATKHVLLGTSQPYDDETVVRRAKTSEVTNRLKPTPTRTFEMEIGILISYALSKFNNLRCH